MDFIIWSRFMKAISHIHYSDLMGQGVLGTPLCAVYTHTGEYTVA